ncbi:MAG: hypothetical protein HY650_12785 [Acidobacteria bacterium]|nr:hypothetical protein [Acidobacteriota bacterium]
MTTQIKSYFHRAQRGSILFLAAVGSLVMLGGAAFSVDVGYFFLVKNQLQNAADAAALAGAQGLMLQPSNFTSGGRAVTLATEYAAMNYAANQPVQLQPSEITFPKGNVIMIDLTRPARTFFASVVGMNQVNIRVRSAAAVATVNGGTGGWRPWAPMDQFGHGSECVGPNDADVNTSPHGDFKTTSHTWKGVTVPTDRYVSPYNPSVGRMDLSLESDCSQVTGYITPRDVMLDNGTIDLKVSSWLTPGNFGPVALGGTGGSDYRTNIREGWDGTLTYGDIIDTEPGNMVGPTKQGHEDLIAMDPSAHLAKDSSTGRWVVLSNAYGVNESPRIVPIPMYSPLEAPVNGRNNFPVRSFGAFFIHSAPNGKTVRGTFIGTLMHGAPQEIPRAGSQSSGAGGQLLGTVALVDPAKY